MKRTPLKRGASLRRRTRLRLVNRVRMAKRRARDFGDQAQLCRRSHCPACGAWPCDPHHWPTRARGGTDRDCMPLCRACHTLVHTIGVYQFYARTRVDVVAEVRHFQSGGPVHSGKCTASSICNSCQSHAESANERNVYRGS